VTEDRRGAEPHMRQWQHHDPASVEQPTTSGFIIKHKPGTGFGLTKEVVE
jgi:hypothetical protein